MGLSVYASPQYTGQYSLTGNQNISFLKPFNERVCLFKREGISSVFYTKCDAETNG